MYLDNNKSARDYISAEYRETLKAILERAKLTETPASIIEREKIAHMLELAQKEQAVRERRDECQTRLREIEELQATVDSIPTLEDQARAEGAADMEKELGKDYGCELSPS